MMTRIHRGVCTGFFKQQNFASPGNLPIRHGRQFFDIERDRAGPVFGQRRAIAQYDGDRLADITHAVGADHWLKKALRAG